MEIKLRIVGLPGFSPGEQMFELSEGTLADAKERLLRFYPALPLDEMFVGFVNGKAVGREWDAAVLKDGDAVMLVVPMSGG